MFYKSLHNFHDEACINSVVRLPAPSLKSGRADRKRLERNHVRQQKYARHGPDPGDAAKCRQSDHQQVVTAGVYRVISRSNVYFAIRNWIIL